MKTIKGYKFIESDMKSKNGECVWRIGKWKKHPEKIELCEYEYHACRKPLEAFDYIYGDYFCIVEARGEIIDKKGDKFVASEMRVTKVIKDDTLYKRFAIECAKDCLKYYKKEYPNDTRVSDAIKAAEYYIDGKISLKELSAAASAARSAAASAARSAAWSAAWSAASSAAWSVESAESSAARSAARSAAWSAASAAKSAARSAAWSAESVARSAARSAAWSAARKRQNKILKDLLKEFT